MTTISPTEEKPNALPTYDQAIYNAQQVPPAPPFHGQYPMGPNTFQPHAPGFQTGMYPHSVMMMSPQGQPMGTHMVITTQSSLFGDVPIQCICSHCHQPIVTRVEQQTGLIAWLICAAILLLGGWLGCCLIPFCIDSLKDTEHYCPNCAVLLGTRRRM